MGKKNRAERRHHHQRMIDKVKEFWYLRKDRYWGSEDQRQKHIRQMAETRHPCSCDACRNPRHSAYIRGEEKLTMQERRIREYERYEE